MNVTAPTCVRETSAEGSSLQPASSDAPTATSTHAAAVLAQAQGTSTYEGILARGFFNLGRRREIDFLDTLERPSEYARRAFLEVAEAAGVDPRKILFRASDYAGNALAMTVYRRTGGGLQQVPLIAYSPEFMRGIEVTSDNAMIGKLILAHEIGHHVHGHTLPDRPEDRHSHPWRAELEADEFAGYVAAKLGATPADLAAAQRVMFTMHGSESHPDSFRRIEALLRGWLRGGGEGDLEQLTRAIAREIVDDISKW